MRVMFRKWTAARGSERVVGEKLWRDGWSSARINHEQMATMQVIDGMDDDTLSKVRSDISI